jgi:hypothetical protein
MPVAQHEARSGIRQPDSEAFLHHKNYYDVTKEDQRDDQ